MTRYLALAICLLMTATAALAHGGDDHDHEEAATTVQGGPAPRLELAGEDLELVATVADRTLAIYLDRLATNEPVDGATITVTADGIAAGTAKAAGGAGVYELAAPWADEPGHKALKFTVKLGEGQQDLAGELEIAAAPTAAPAPTVAWSELVTSPRVWMLAGLAAMLGFVAAFAFRPARLPDAVLKADSAPAKLPAASKAAALLAVGVLSLLAGIGDARAHEGHDHADEEQPAATASASATPRRLPDGDVFLPKPSQRLLHVRTVVAEPRAARQARELIGTVAPDPSTFGQVQAPMDGRIELSERGISHVGQRVEAGEVLAYLSPSIPIADLGTMQQLRADVAGKLKIAEQKLARLTRIASVVAQKDIEDTRAELEALREQQRVLAQKDVERMPLTAPVSGIISVANVRAGQVVTTRETLFEIVDPHRLWIEAISGVDHAPSISAAHATDPDGHSIRLSYVGRAPSLRQQTQPLQFQVEERHDGLVIGSAVKVFVQQGEPVEGIILPDAAIVRGPNGLPRAWEKLSAERFRPLAVRVVPVDGVNTLVLAGIKPGARIVVDGAELIDQVR